LRFVCTVAGHMRSYVISAHGRSHYTVAGEIGSYMKLLQSKCT